MALTASNLANGQLPNSLTSLYPATAAKTCLIKSVILHNTDSIDQRIRLYLNAGTSRTVADKLLAPAETFVFVPEKSYVIENGDTIEGEADDASVVDYWISGAEETTPVTGVIPFHAADGQIAATPTSVFTAASLFYLTGITLYNTDTGSAGQQVEIWVSDGANRKIVDICLRPLTPFYFFAPMILDSTDEIIMNCEAPSVVDYWIDGIYEV